MPDILSMQAGFIPNEIKTFSIDTKTLMLRIIDFFKIKYLKLLLKNTYKNVFQKIRT